MKRRFLLLQGVCSPFFDKLGIALREHGHSVLKINFNAGDSWYWNHSNKLTYRKSVDQLPEYYTQLFDQQDFTDIVLFGEHRPVHKPAILLAKRRNIQVHVFEEGYFRPYWITLERGGVNAHSSLPRDPVWYRRKGPMVPDYGNGVAFKSTFSARAWHDVVYHSAGLRNSICYPGYINHAPVSAAREYAAYLQRAAKLFRLRNKDAAAIQKLIYSREPYWLLPLQLNSDAQIREHSPFQDMRELLHIVMRSFSRMCRPDATLVIKNHPLDTGIWDHEQAISAICSDIGLPRKRILFLESGPLPALLNHTRGVVTVNSTVGGSALVHGRPLIALGDAIYNMPGLTFQGELDDFWRHTKRPDPKLFRWFRNVVIHTTQINGGFYNSGSIDMAVKGALPRLLAKKTPLELLS